MKEINYLNAMKLINCDRFNELEDDEYLKKFMVFINKHKELFSYAIEKDSSRFILKMINNGFEMFVFKQSTITPILFFTLYSGDLGSEASTFEMCISFLNALEMSYT